jgi:V8-like Glu-specific endopeptidase
MQFDEKLFTSALEQNDQEGVYKSCTDFVRSLYQNPVETAIPDLERMMAALRGKRMFKVMVLMGDACVQTGRVSFKIRRQYAQALIEEGIYTGALAILNDLVKDTTGNPDKAVALEYREAVGLTGRIYKQLYIKSANAATSNSQRYMNKALEAYAAVYKMNEKENTWHGINVVALAARASEDKIDTGIDKKVIAEKVLKEIEDLVAEEKATAFDLATAMEACVALHKKEDALKWAKIYIQSSNVDSFQIASTLRQLTEVWQLDLRGEEEQQLIPLLRGALLKKEGGSLVVGADEIQKGLYNKGDLLKNPEKVFGQDSYQTYDWYMKGARRCMVVARIGREESKGFGTGFLMEGNVFNKTLTGELVLVTNAHVVTNDDNEREALRPADALVSFEVLGLKNVFNVSELFFTSPFKELDTTILRFNKADNDLLRSTLKQKEVDLYKISDKLPEKQEKGRVYIIGHPAGGILQLSLQDNAMLDYEDRLLHYRTPTVGGSSGSPVFNEYWELIGLHHAGGNYMRKLNKQRGMYQANEGIWIKSIIDATSKL